MNKDVRTLLDQYDTYVHTQKQQQRISRQLAIAKVSGEAPAMLQAQYDALGATLQELSDAMCFSSPLVWIEYKYEAYKNEAQPIRTMKELRLHCSKPGYICTKRFEFLNEVLLNRGQAPLSDIAAYPDEQSLATLLGGSVLNEMTSDVQCMQRWTQYEYHKVGDRTAKWENWKT